MNVTTGNTYGFELVTSDNNQFTNINLFDAYTRTLNMYQAFNNTFTNYNFSNNNAQIRLDGNGNTTTRANRTWKMQSPR